MKDGDRKVYDDKEAAMRKKRMADNDKFDKMNDEARGKEGFDKMTKDKKMAFMKK